jgi:hypothetical protein
MKSMSRLLAVGKYHAIACTTVMVVSRGANIVVVVVVVVAVVDRFLACSLRQESHTISSSVLCMNE